MPSVQRCAETLIWIQKAGLNRFMKYGLDGTRAVVTWTCVRVSESLRLFCWCEADFTALLLQKNISNPRSPQGRPVKRVTPDSSGSLFRYGTENIDCDQMRLSTRGADGTRKWERCLGRGGEFAVGSLQMYNQKLAVTHETQEHHKTIRSCSIHIIQKPLLLFSSHVCVHEFIFILNKLGKSLEKSSVDWCFRMILIDRYQIFFQNLSGFTNQPTWFLSSGLRCLTVLFPIMLSECSWPFDPLPHEHRRSSCHCDHQHWKTSV